MRLVAFASLLILPIVACDSSGGQGAGTVQQTGDTASGVDALGGDDTATAPSDTSTTTAPPADTFGPADTSTPPADTSTPPEDTSTPPQDTSTPPQDTTVVGGAAVGGPCTADSDCAGPDPYCIDAGDFSGGYCAVSNCGSQGNACPDGSTCFSFGEGNPNLCIKDCTEDSECRVAEGYECDAYDTCWPASGVEPTGDSPVGGPCEVDADCADAGAFCYPAELSGEPTGFYKGYCMIAGCTEGSCPAGATCQAIFSDGSTACVGGCSDTSQCEGGYTCYQPGLCWPGCADSACDVGFACDAAEDYCVADCQNAGCPDGLHCWDDGTCGDPPCTAGSCTAGYVCGGSGHCIPDLSGGPGPGPGPTCAAIPERDCAAGTSACATWSQFLPTDGPGYTNYPLNGETWANQYRSFARLDLQMLVKWAAATVDCKAAAWGGGNGAPLGLGDMSEENGDIPGTSVGSPGHPEGTHTNGTDMDIAYFQNASSPDNILRIICPTGSGNDAYRCVGPPDKIDLWRSAYFIGLLAQSPRTRVIGVDGQVGPLVEQAQAVLCDQGWLSGTPCGSGWNKLAYEVEDEGLGWFYFHHHHLHVSMSSASYSAPLLPGEAPRVCLTPGCAPTDAHDPHGHGCQVTPTLDAPMLPRRAAEPLRRMP